MSPLIRQLNALTLSALPPTTRHQQFGKLVKVNGLTLEVVGCTVTLGQRCHLETQSGKPLLAEVVGFDRNITFLTPLEPVHGIFAGAKVTPLPGDEEICVGPHLLGRIFDGLMQPLDGKPLEPLGEWIPLHADPINPLVRQPIEAPLDVGIRAINGILTAGKGQRLGLFAGSGVGKSMLMGMMTRYTKAQIVVVGLIGERGREVREFIEQSLGKEGLAKAIVIAAPADQSPLLRVRSAELCHRIAEYFRDAGNDVLLLVDSLTRYAQAHREIALAVGEPPATRGYPPSVFSLLTKLVERAGNGAHPDGSLTAFYTVLAEGDDQQDPVVDAARAILDGHIVLTRQLAEAGHYPAIDISASISRVMPQIVPEKWLKASQRLRQYFSRYQQIKELLPLGAYQAGSDPEMDTAVQRYPALAAFLKQGLQEQDELETTLTQMQKITG